jgi:hypothetical protein
VNSFLNRSTETELLHEPSVQAGLCSVTLVLTLPRSSGIGFSLLHIVPVRFRYRNRKAIVSLPDGAAKQSTTASDWTKLKAIPAGLIACFLRSVLPSY